MPLQISSVMEVDGAARQPSAAFSAGLPYPSQRSSTPEAERAQNLQDAQQGTEVPGSGAEKDEPQEPSVSGAAGGTLFPTLPPCLRCGLRLSRLTFPYMQILT